MSRMVISSIGFLLLVAGAHVAVGSAVEPMSADVDSGLIAHWKMDVIVPPMSDAVGTNHGTCERCPEDVPGRVNGALDFGGGNDGVEVAYDPSLDFGVTDSFTIAMWIRSSQDFTGNKYFIGKYRGSRTNKGTWWLGGGGNGAQPVLGTVDSDGISHELVATQSINNGDWHHLVGIQDRTEGQLRLYVDGVLDVVQNTSYTGDFTGSGRVLFGYYGNLTNHNYDGLLDDVRLYNRALSAEGVNQLSIIAGQVHAGSDQLLLWRGDPVLVQLDGQVTDGDPPSAALLSTWEQLSGPAMVDFEPSQSVEDPRVMFSAPGVYTLQLSVSSTHWEVHDEVTIEIRGLHNLPTAYWPLDGDLTDAINDWDGVPPAGTPGPTPVEKGKINGAMAFDGTANAVDVPGDGFNWRRDASFSLECWFKASETPGADSNQVIVGRVDQAKGLNWWVGLDTVGQSTFQLEAGTGDGIRVTGSKNLNDGQWHHCVAVRDALTGENRLYVDGRVEGLVSHVYTEGFDSSSAHLTIGHLNAGSGHYFGGTLDELLIYPRALTVHDVRLHYYLVRGYLERHIRPVTIMPLGDSITFDNASYLDNPVPRPRGQRVSYRYPLYEMLTEAGYWFDFVGSLRAGHDIFPDADNAGYPGYADNEITTLLNTGFSPNSTVFPGAPGPYLKHYPADVILLHIGTNDLESSPKDIEDILNEVDEFSPDTTVILARIINRLTYDRVTTLFNNNIEAMALARVAQGDKILIVDMEDGASMVYSGLPAGDMGDNLHPAPSGYAKMAQLWFAALHTVLPEKALPGDINGDGCVSGPDLALFAMHWRQGACAWPTWCDNADLDQAQIGSVDGGDLLVLAENWLRCRIAVSNLPPRIQITNLSLEQTISLPFDIIAHAQDIDGMVVKVEFLVNDIMVAEDNDGQDGWQFNWQDYDTGSYELKARATDNSGAVTPSATMPVTVKRGR